MSLNIRELFIWKVIFFSIFLVLSTEILSFFDNINAINLKFLWSTVLIIFLLGIFYLCKKRIIFSDISKKKDYILSFEFYFIVLILTLTFINSLLYPPNTLDAMSYHMTKVMHWAQNSNVNFYPTQDLRQLILAPFAEYVILHLYLLSGTDSFSNLVQWYSMFISCMAVSLIVKEFGCNYKLQIFSILFCTTLPMGILQSSSTQTDYVASMWLIIMVYFLLKYINSGFLKYIFGFACSLAIGILTKGTVYIFAFSFCVWMGTYVILKYRSHFLYLFIIPILIIIINFGHFNRNINLFQNPLGLTEKNNNWTNDVINIKTLTANFTRNVGLNLSVPNKKINNFTAKKITSSLEQLNISTSDPATTRIPRYGYYIPFSFYESSAPNTLHFIIILFVIFLIIYKRNLSNNEKNYFYSTIASFVFFSLLLKWTSVHNRLLLSFFILSAPIVSYVLYKVKSDKIIKVIIISVSIYSIPYVLFNKSRPLLAEMKLENGGPKFYKPFFLKETRNELYFIADRFYNSRDLHEYYSKIEKKLEKFNCDRIGFDGNNTNLEYPLWVLLKSPDLKIYNINVENKSSSIKADNDNLCAIVYANELKIIN